MKKDVDTLIEDTIKQLYLVEEVLTTDLVRDKVSELSGIIFDNPDLYYIDFTPSQIIDNWLNYALGLFADSRHNSKVVNNLMVIINVHGYIHYY